MCAYEQVQACVHMRTCMSVRAYVCVRMGAWIDSLSAPEAGGCIGAVTQLASIHNMLLAASECMGWTSVQGCDTWEVEQHSPFVHDARPAIHHVR